MSSRPSRGAARLASILDALPDALLLVDVNGTVVNANAIALETFESPGTALVGRGLLDLLPSFDSKRIPGSMRSPRETAEESRTKPTRMVARRTDGTEFPVEVTSANLENGRSPYADYGDGVPHYTGDELLMLAVRDLQHTVDTEAELARQQRQTEMILRAAAEGVVGVDTAGKIVLVNPSAAQILGHRATDLGGKELHPLVHHSRPDGTPLAYEETPLADTLRSGRKHRVRGQVLWRKDGRAVPVDLTTAPVREGDQLVGAVMTFTDRTAYDALAARTGQLRALLDVSLRGPLAELRGELTGLAADPAGHLWPEANQILHHLSAGYARITTLIDNVLAFQRLDRGEEKLRRAEVGLDEVVSAAVEGAIELIGPGRAQYAVHAPPVTAVMDAERMAQALAHLVADVAGVDSAGNTIAFSGDSTIVVAAAKRGDVVRIDVRGPHAGGDPVHLPLARGIVERHGGVLQTHEVPGQGSAYVLEIPAGAQEPGDGAGPRKAMAADGGDPTSGAGTRAGSDTATGTRRAVDQADQADHQADQAGDAAGVAAQRPARPRQADDDTGTVVAPWAIPGGADPSEAPTGRRRALRRPGEEAEGTPAGGTPADAGAGAQPSGRRARRPRPEDGADEADGRPALPAPPVPSGLPVLDSGVQGSPGTPGNSAHPAHPAHPNGQEGTGRRARRALEPAARALEPAARDQAPGGVPVPVPVPPRQGPADGGRPTLPARHPQQPAPSDWPDAQAPVPGPGPGQSPGQSQGQIPGRIPGQGVQAPADPSGRRAAPHPQQPEPGPWPEAPGQGQAQRQTQGQTEPQNPGHDPQAPADPSGRRAVAHPQPPEPGSWPAPQTPALPAPAAPSPDPNRPALPAQPSWPAAPQSGATAGPIPSVPSLQGIPGAPGTPGPGSPGAQNSAGVGAGTASAAASAGSANSTGTRPPAQDQSQSSHGRAISVRTLGQGVAFGGVVDPHSPEVSQSPTQTPTQAVQAQHPQGLPAQVAAGGSGRRRRLAPRDSEQHPQQAHVPNQPLMPNQTHGPGGETEARQHPQADPDSGQLPVRRPEPGMPVQQEQQEQQEQRQEQRHDDPGAAPLRPVPGDLRQDARASGRSYAIGAPAAGAAEGPEPLDGPNGAVDVTDVTDDHQEEPLDEPRRLLVWPEPDVSTRQALTDRGYRPVIVRSREEVDAQVAEPPAALFVDPLTGPITRTALQSLRQAAAAADVPVLVTAGLGQATREAAYGADPAVLLKALAPRDSEQHPPRVLLVESHEPIAQAFSATLERRGMQVTHAGSEADAMTKAAQVHPNLVVMDLMLIRRRRQGIVDWLRGHSRLNSTPLVVYTSADIDPDELPRLASGETVLFLAERSTSTDVQSRIVDLLGKIGT